MAGLVSGEMPNVKLDSSDVDLLVVGNGVCQHRKSRLVQLEPVNRNTRKFAAKAIDTADMVEL